MEKALKRSSPIFVIPTFLAFIIGFIVPFLMGIYLSFCEFVSISDASLVGFKNYTRAFTDAFSEGGFMYSLGFTAAFTVVSLIVINVIAFALAMLLTKKLKGTNVFRTVYFLPNLIGGIVLGNIWRLIFDGILMSYNTALNLNSTLGFWGLVILVAWQQIGYMMIIYVAGLQTIPGDLNEAAAIDGANGRQKLFKITIPMMMPSITICTFLSVTNGFKLFDQSLALTSGQPGKSTQTLAYHIYDTFFSRTGFEGVAQAKAVVFFIIVVVIGLLQLRVTRSREVQQ